MYWFRNSLARAGSVRSNITHHNYDRVMSGKKRVHLVSNSLTLANRSEFGFPPKGHNYDDHKTISFQPVDVYH